MVSAWNSSIYDYEIFVTEQVAGVLSPMLLLPAVIWFRPSLQIHTPKILVFHILPEWETTHNESGWKCSLFSIKGQAERRYQKITKCLCCLFFLLRYITYLKTQSQLYFLPMGLNNIPSQPKPQSHMPVFSMLSWSTGDSSAPEFMTEISTVKFTINVFPPGKPQQASSSYHPELRHSWRRFKSHSLSLYFCFLHRF